MYTDGGLLTAGEKTRLHRDPFGVRTYAPDKCFDGYTLICECDAGHLFEVTPEKEIVWDFWSPFVGQGPHHLGKRIHRATRYSPQAVEPLLQSRQDRIVSEVDRDGRRVNTFRELIDLYQS